MGTDRGRFYICTWYQPVHDLGTRKLYSQMHKVRDGLALVQISSLLTECGFRFSGAILNVPSSLPSPPSLRHSDFRPAADDLVWIPTRLPLEEFPVAAPEKRPRRLRIIDRSGSPLEKRILAGFAPYFTTCRRTRIALSNAISLDKQSHTYRVCDFQEFSGGLLTRHGAVANRLLPARADRMTIGYLIALPPQEGLGRLVAAFGPGGTETLIFSHLLSTLFRENVLRVIRNDAPAFLMVKFFMPQYVPAPLLAFTPQELAAKLITDQTLCAGKPA